MNEQSSRFTYIQYDEVAIQKQRNFHNLFNVHEKLIEETLPDSREKSLALTALEEAYMWIGKAIKNDQLARTGEKPKEKEERGQSDFPLTGGIPEGMRKYRTTFFFANESDEEGREPRTRWFESWSISKEKAIEVHTAAFRKVEMNVKADSSPNVHCEDVTEKEAQQGAEG